MAGGYTPLHTNEKEINRTLRKIEGLHLSFNSVLTWKMEVFYPSWILIFTLAGS